MTASMLISSHHQPRHAQVLRFFISASITGCRVGYLVPRGIIGTVQNTSITENRQKIHIKYSCDIDLVKALSIRTGQE
jgi:hypothetical protein